MGARGERVIQAGEKEITVLFTNRALADAEQAMGKSVFEVARGLTNGQSGIGDIAQLLRAGMQAARRDAGERPIAVSIDRAYAILDEAGVIAVAAILMEALTAVLSYSASGEGEPEDADPN
jgi:hypothetical protein